MLNFDEARFIKIQTGAVQLAPRIDDAISAALSGGAKNLYFLGTGGVAYLMQPAHLLLQRRSSFPTFVDYPAELVLTGSANLTSDSLAVIPSLSGTTKESVAMLSALKEIGATTMTLVGHEDTPLGREGDHVFVNFAEDDTSSESFYLQSLCVALSVMKSHGDLDEGTYDRYLNELTLLPELLLEVKRGFEPQAEGFASIIAGADYHMFTGAGNTWPQAHYYGMCILEEMQWIRTRPVHASDFFHGALELIEKDVSLILFKGEDAYRPLADRVEKFAPNFTDKLTVLDSRDFSLPGISDDVRGLISPIVLATVLERVSAHLEVMRDHPLVTRRYYKQFDY
jgi:fructoselysine-6-phosphate deglycase